MDILKMTLSYGFLCKNLEFQAKFLWWKFNIGVGKWLGVSRHQAITQNNVEPHLSIHYNVTSQNELTLCGLVTKHDRNLSTSCQKMACHLLSHKPLLESIQFWVIKLDCGLVASHQRLNSLAPGRFVWNLRSVKLPSGECPWTLLINISSGNGFVLSGNKPLPELVLTEINDTIGHNKVMQTRHNSIANALESRLSASSHWYEIAQL